jgi:hypothetical protein
VNVTPAGSVPVRLRLGTGEPVAVTLNVPTVDVVNVALLRLEMPSGGLTTREKVCVDVPAVLVEVSVRGNVPAEVVVPANIAVPFRLSVKVIPDGNVPLTERLGAGRPLVATVNEPADPPCKVTVPLLVIAGV